MKNNFFFRLAGKLFLAVSALLIGFNSVAAGIIFTPKDGKLWVKASGELLILKSEAGQPEYFILKLEDQNRYILSGKFSRKLKKLTGKIVEISGLLRERIGFFPDGPAGRRELIPSIEVRSVKEASVRLKK